MYKLLIADDEPLEREVLRLFVEESNLEIDKILECANGTDAIRTALLEKPEIVLLDINMPGMDGLEVLDKLRVSDKRIKVIISSAYDYFEYARKAMQLEAMDFLVKPVNKTVLMGALNKAIDELDAEASTENLLSRMAVMVETMGKRLAADLIGGAASSEAQYYLETVGLRPNSGGAVFHIRLTAAERKLPEIGKEMKEQLSFLGTVTLCADKDDRIALIVFPKGAPVSADFFDRAEDTLRSALRNAGAEFVLGRGTVFDNPDEIHASYLAARKNAGDPEEREEAEAPAPTEICRIREFIEANYSKKIGLDDIAEAVGFSKFHICRIFKQNTGTTIVDYLVRRRIDKSKELLKDGSYSIKQISGMVGYTDPNYFTWTFKKAEGISPVRYRYANSGKL